MKEITVEEFFCIVNAMYEFEEAKNLIQDVLKQWKKKLSDPDIKDVFLQLSDMAANLYGIDSVINETSDKKEIKKNRVVEETNIETSRYLETTDDFYDDGKVDVADADIAFNLTLHEVSKKESSSSKSKKKKKKGKKNLEDDKNSPVILWFRRDLR